MPSSLKAIRRSLDEIGFDVGPACNAAVQSDEAGNAWFKRFHAPGKSVAEPLHDLEQRKIHVSQPPPGDIGSAVALQYLLEIRKIFGHALLPEFLGSFLGGRALVLIVKRRSKRMMGVVSLEHQIRDGELELMHPQHSCLGFRGETVPRAEVEQNAGGLPDHQLAGLQERRRKWRRSRARLHHAHHRGHPALTARDIGVGDACLLKREADIFSAALDARPVIELVAHAGTFLRRERRNESALATVCRERLAANTVSWPRNSTSGHRRRCS